MSCQLSLSNAVLRHLISLGNFGVAVVDADLLVEFAEGTLANCLTSGLPLCGEFAPLRGMERKIRNLPRAAGAKLVVPAFSIAQKAAPTEKYSLSIEWDSDFQLYTTFHYPSHDETEQSIMRGVRVRRMLEEVVRGTGAGTGLPAGYSQVTSTPAKSRGLTGQLTPREREVVALLASGQTNKGVARILGLSAKTVEVHRARALQRLNAKTTADLIRIALESGLISSGATRK